MRVQSGFLLLIASLFLLTATQARASGPVCDVDLDGDIDRLDIELIRDARGETISVAAGGLRCPAPPMPT
jgi:hypothetical protein